MSKRKKISFLSAIFLLLSFSQPAKSQTDAPLQATLNVHQWGAVTLFNGLPSDNVRAVAQTFDGVLWFGTDNGLARFDGRRVQVVALETSGTSKIRALAASEDGETLWIGTGNGAFLYRNNQFRKVEETKDFAVNAILFSEDIFLATDEGAILKLKETSPNVFQVEKIPAETLVGSNGQTLKITSLAEKDKTLIAGTRSRSILLVENNRTFETFSRPRPFFVNALAADKQGNVWLGADADEAESGLFSLADIARPNKIGAALGNVLALEPDENGGVWVGTETNGLFHFRGDRQLAHFTFENTAGGLRSNTIYRIFVDRESVVWIGTNRGISRYDAASPLVQTLAENRNSNFVRTLYQTGDGQIFAGTNRGLFLLSDEMWLETENFSGKTVYAVAEDASKRVLVGTPAGLFGFDGKQRLAGDVRSIANFQGKTYAAIFGRGVVEIESQTVIFNSDSPTALLANGDKLWIGTARDGAFVFDGKETKSDNRVEVLRSSAVWKIAASDDGKELWFAAGRGLFLFKDGNLEELIEGEDVRDIIASGTDVWAATAAGGVFHLRRDDRFGWLRTNLSVEQGLPSEKTFSLLKLENQLLIGTNRGAAVYAPSNVAPKTITARVLSQRLHEQGELAETIRLDYPQNSLLVEVAGVSSRTFPEQFQYAFLLKNAGGETLEKRLSNDAQFAPANLKPGEYSIEAIAFNKDLLASEPLIVRFTIARAPFPRTAASLGVLLAIALIALIWAFVEHRRIRQRNRELAAARLDLANEAERERRRIARDLHDQTLADLRALMMKSDKLPSPNGDFRGEIEAVSTEIRRICEDLSPSVLENVGLVAALEFVLSHTTESYKFSVADNLEERLKFSRSVQMQIYRIAQEVLTNIKRHGNAQTIEMKIDVSTEENFILEIKDDGAAFEPAFNSAPQGRGIANIKSRAALIEAEISWQRRENGGTRFQLKKKT